MLNFIAEQYFLRSLLPRNQIEDKTTKEKGRSTRPYLSVFIGLSRLFMASAIKRLRTILQAQISIIFLKTFSYLSLLDKNNNL